MASTQSPPWEEKALSFGLDELCMQALQSIPSERAHQILADLEKMGDEAWDDAETLRRALENDVWASLLDDSAKSELQRVEPSCALGVLADVRALGDDVRNPSSYVCATLRKRMAEGKLVAAAGFKPTAAAAAQTARPGPALLPRVAPSAAPPALLGRPAPTAAAPAFVRTFFAGPANTAPLAQPQRTPPPLPQATAADKAEIDLVVAELAPDLDERAVERVYMLGSKDEARKALEVLVDMGSEVRNKSAFMHGVVAKRLKVLAETEAAQREELEEQERAVEFEAELKEWEEELDEKARGVLIEVQEKLGTMAAMQVLKELSAKMEQGDLRNISGFAYSMARTRLSGGVQTPWGKNIYAQPVQQPLMHPGGFAPTSAYQQQAGHQNSNHVKAWSTESGGEETYREYKEMMASWSEEIDEKAQKLLEELADRLGVAVACGVLKELALKVEKEEVRNVSSFVFSMARQRLNGVPQGAQANFAAHAQAQMQLPAMQGPPLRAPVPASAVFRPTPSFNQTPHHTASRRWIEDTLTKFGLSGQLDDIVLDKMQSSQPERILEILQDMNDKEEPVRNPSAFIQKSLKDFPLARKRNAEGDYEEGPGQKRSRQETDDPLAKHWDMVERMDEAAVAKLKSHPDKDRVRDILAEMAAKLGDIRNPSAFVVRALNEPNRRDALGPMY